MPSHKNLTYHYHLNKPSTHTIETIQKLFTGRPWLYFKNALNTKSLEGPQIARR